MAGDYHQTVHRLLRLILLLQQPVAGNATALAHKLGVQPRSIYRYLKILTGLGIPHYFDRQAGTYRMRKAFFLPPVHLSVTESLALISLSENLGGQEQIAMTAPAAAAIEKIRSMLPAKVQDELGDVPRHIDIQLHATGTDSKAIEDVYQTIQASLRNRRVLSCVYESLQGSSDTAFDFHPYVLSFDQRAWYVIGYHTGRKDVRRLKLTRFAALKLTSRKYTMPRDFSLDTFRGKAWRMIRGDKLYDITIEFDAVVGETVADTNWHPTQTIDEHPDGSITFHCQVEGLNEILWWILSYGPHARVVKPQALAKLIIEKTQATAKLYT